MKAKVKEIKTIRRKRDSKILKTAEICGCTPRMVRYALDDVGNQRPTPLAENIVITYDLLTEQEQQMMTDLKNRLK